MSKNSDSRSHNRDNSTNTHEDPDVAFATSAATDAAEEASERAGGGDLSKDPDYNGPDLSELDIDTSSRTAKALVTSIDQAVKAQAPVIATYVDKLRKESKPADKQRSAKEVQELIDKHFVALASTSGASVGATAAIPGIGFLTGSAAVAAESVLFVEQIAWYTVASAYVRGIDIHDPEQRRALVYATLLGSKGSAIVDTLVDDLGSGGVKGATSAATLSRFSGPKLGTINNMLAKTVIKQASKRFRRMWLGKIMPLGLGAVIGTVANRRLAKRVISNADEVLGPITE